jgi:tetratricopeptide (TPR) repeat protein
LWIREGFAVYYAATGYDEGFNRAVYEENLAWLDTLKDMVAGTSSRPWIPWEELVFLSLSDAQEMADSFYPQAWGLVSFLLNAEDPAINRLAWDSIRALEPENSLQENSEAVYQHSFRWVNRDEIQNRFSRYVMSLRTFSQWVSTGVDRYDGDDPEGAERAMVEALRLRRDHHVPFYYLGLINYDREDYETAAYYYGEALNRTDSPEPVLYALAVNAIADDRQEDAREYLESVIAGDGDGDGDEGEHGIREEAETLLRRLAPSGGR